MVDLGSLGGRYTRAYAVDAAGTVVGETTVGWLIDGSSDRSVGALADLLQRGIRVRVARKPFKVSDRDYDRGALLVRVEGNPEDLASVLTQVAERWKVTIEPAGGVPQPTGVMVLKG